MSRFFKHLVVATESDDILRSSDGEQIKSPETHPELMESGDATLQDFVDEDICEEVQDFEDAVGDIVAAQSDVELVESASEIIGATDPKAETLVTRAAVESFHNILNLMRERYDLSGDGVVISKESAVDDVRPMIAAEASEVLGKMKAKAINAWQKLVEWFKGLWDKFFTSSGKRIRMLRLLDVRAKKHFSSPAPEGSYQTTAFWVDGKAVDALATAEALTAIVTPLTELAGRAEEMDRIESNTDVTSIDVNPKKLGGVNMEYPYEGTNETPTSAEAPLGSGREVSSAATTASEAIDDIARLQGKIKKHLGFIQKFMMGMGRSKRGGANVEVTAGFFTPDDQAWKLASKASGAFMKIAARALTLAMRTSFEIYKWGEASLKAIEASGKTAPATEAVDLTQVQEGFRFRGQGRFTKNDVSDAQVK